MDGDIERRLREIRDRIELQELIVKYALYIDSRDFDALASLWAENAVFDSVAGRTVGRSGIIEYYRNRMRTWGMTFHVPHGQVLERLEGDEAEGYVLAHAEVVIDGVALFSGLRYYDRYRREDGAWRFQERIVQQMYALPVDQLASGMPTINRKRWPGTTPQPADIPEPLETWQRYHSSVQAG